MKIGSITHEELVKAIADAAHSYGWRVSGFRAVRVQRKDGSIYHTTPIMFQGKGWPDLFLCHETRHVAIAIEVKVKGDKLKPEQTEWLELLDQCGIPAYEFRESEWVDGSILAVLQ